VALSLRQKIGQNFFIGLSGKELTDEERSFIIANNIGGVVLFARNCETPEQIHQLICQVQEAGQKSEEKVPLWVGIDMEGGRVHRLKSPFTIWPAMRQLGKLDSPSMAFRFAEALGRELKAVGINLNFSPSVDVLTNPMNQVIGDRALSSDPEQVSKLGSGIVRGFIKADILPVAKHFPGHGQTSVDSHVDLPVESTTLSELKERELIPFKKVFRARLDIVMTAHVLFQAIDPDWPASLSEVFLHQILRKDIGYRGLVITDDLDMGALRNRWSQEEIAVQAVHAGAHFLLYCNDPSSPEKAITAIEKALESNIISKNIIENNHKLAIELKSKKLKSYSVSSYNELKHFIGCGEHQELALAIKEGRILEATSQADSA